MPFVGLADLLEHNDDSPERVLDYTHKIQSSSRHMLGLISDLLDMAKLENGKLRSNIHPMDLRDQINQIETMIRPQAEKRPSGAAYHHRKSAAYPSALPMS